MTAPLDLIACDACPARRSTLPFDLAEMIAVRLLPAQFARVVGVSKQSVSKWIRAGKVTLGPDGRLDPVAGIQEVLNKTAPTRLRARIFRQAMQGADAMRAEIRTLQRRCVQLESEARTCSTDLRAEVARLQRALVVAGDHKAAAVAKALEREGRVMDAYRREIASRFDQLAIEHARGVAGLRFELECIESLVRSRPDGLVRSKVSPAPKTTTWPDDDLPLSSDSEAWR